jgi:glycosyltransferase involved in cell wall biosynthesis
MKLACVVHRFGSDIAGGSEAHCRHVATHLAAAGYDVTILTTCARDHISWRNEYPPGPSTLEGLKVLRFPVVRQRSLHRFADVSGLAFSGTATEAEQEAWFRENGPDAPALLEHLREDGRSYDCVLFWAFRYAEVYFGLPFVADRAVLVPTAEEDPVIRMPILERLFALPAGYVFLTPEEQELVEQRMTAPKPSCIIGSGLDPAPPRSTVDLRSLGVRDPFILYLGRIDPNKGCADLLHHFMRYKAEHPGPVQLVMAGPASMPIPDHPDVRPLGFVDEPTRAALLEQAVLLAMPSRFESLSLVLLEAWNHALPAVVNGYCAVLKGQALRANGALYYRNYDEFERCISVLLDDRDLGRQLGAQGLAYVEREYRWPTVVARINVLLSTVTAPRLS